ncbi:STAS domain-containing protein [Alteribacillus sp. HJP-4]|uniref:STAS domain-containing protein n=1 Tax=Alteribacillus sp. HJP-4 TaxID=2775394 RepID=UPI0035CCFCCE
MNQTNFAIEKHLHFIPGIIWIADENLVLKDIQGELLTAWNLEREKLIGKSIAEFTDEGAHGRNTFFHKKTLSTQEATYRTELFGSTYECKLRWEDESSTIICVATDISDRILLEEEISKKKKEVLASSTPIVPLWKDTIILPITGVLDQDKASHIMSSVTEDIHSRSDINYVIIDLSGVHTIDRTNISYIHDIQKIISFLGIETVISGLRPEIVQTLVNSDVRIPNVKTYQSVEQALSPLLRQHVEQTTL